MKNLMSYVNPEKHFDEEGGVVVKVQIDNSLDLGWKREDLVLVTNFEFEYNGVKSIVVSDENYCNFCPQASKILTILDLFDKGIIEKELYWFHDLDAFQLEVINESDIDIDEADVAMTDYGRMMRWTTGSMFFKNTARDIFGWVKDITYKYKTDEERAFMILTGEGTHLVTPGCWGGFVNGYTTSDIPEIGNINVRIKKINITYNFQTFNLRSCYSIAIKPIRVAHFHPFPRPVNLYNPKPNGMEFFVHGNNKLGLVLIPQRLARIFNQYGIK